MRFIVIGGVAAGMSAASVIKRSKQEAEVVVYEKGGVLSYGACGLPYLIGGVIRNPEDLIVRSRERFEAAGIRTFLYHEVMEVGRNKTITVKDLKTGNTFTDRYRKLLIATGASPVRLELPGSGLKGIETLSNYEDGVRIRRIAQDTAVQNVCIIGAGYIGVELADMMRALGKNTVLIESAGQILTPFDEDMAKPLQEGLEKNGVDIRLDEKTTAFEGEGCVKRVVTDKSALDADLVLMCVGVRPNTRFLEGSGIRLLDNGAVKVNKRMECSVEDIYAAGDCASVYHRLLGTYEAYLPLGTSANKQGRTAGKVMCGENARYDAALGTTMLKVCGIEAAKTGLSEKEAQAYGLPCRSVRVTAAAHAPYYPDNEPMDVKLVYQPETREILGAQITGRRDAAIRINMFAIAIHAGMKTHELAAVDFGYAPPITNVWDAVQIACEQAK